MTRQGYLSDANIMKDCELMKMIPTVEKTSLTNVGARKNKYKTFMKPVPAMMTAINLSGNVYEPEKIYKDLKVKYPITTPNNSLKVIKQPISLKQSNTLDIQANEALVGIENILKPAQDPVEIPVGVPYDETTNIPEETPEGIKIGEPVKREGQVVKAITGDKRDKLFLSQIATILKVPNRKDSVANKLRKEYPALYGHLNKDQIYSLLVKALRFNPDALYNKEKIADILEHLLSKEEQVSSSSEPYIPVEDNPEEQEYNPDEEF